MPKIVPIVEGPGDVAAFPALCYKLLHELKRFDIQIDTPLDAKGRSNLTKPKGIERFIELAWKRPGCDAVVVLIDLDENPCAVDLARQLSQRIQAIGTPRCTVAIVVARREYEAWFLGSLPTIVGQKVRENFVLPPDLSFEGDVEEVRDVKKWFTSHIPLVKGLPKVAYNETSDQITLTRLIDPTLVRKRSRSFRRLCSALNQVVEAVNHKQTIVMP